MKKNLYLFLLLSGFAILTAYTQSAKPIMKVSMPGYPTFQCTSNSMMPLGATGGVLTIVKNADNLDQQFNTAMKNNTKFATLDLVYYQQAANGQLSKTQTFHFTNLVFKSIAPNVNKLTAMTLGFDTMTKN